MLKEEIKAKIGVRRRSRFYIIWCNMRRRCINNKDVSYKYYGAKGIKVCDRWLESFENFFEDMYESYQKHVEEYGEKDTTLDRIDVNGNYCKENCRWATNKEQQNNRKDNIYISSEETLSQYCKNHNLNYSAILRRLQNGWELSKALNTPIKHVNKRLKMPTGETLAEYCRQNNLNYNSIYTRIQKGYSIEEAINTPINKTYNSKKDRLTLPSGEFLLDYCRNNNLPYVPIKNRITKGMTLEEAIKSPIQQKIKLPSGEYLVDYCKRNNLKHSTIYARIKKGWPLEKALNTPINKYNKQNNNTK